MKNLKIISIYLLVAAFTLSCETESLDEVEMETLNLEVSEEFTQTDCVSVELEANITRGYEFPAPLDSSTDNYYFSPGDIPQGISFNTNAFVNNLRISPKPYGNLLYHSQYNYLNTSPFHLSINFTTEVYKVAMNIGFLYNNSQDQEITIDVFGESGLIRTSEVNVPNKDVTTLLKIKTSEEIKKIHIYSKANDTWVGISNISFGNNCFPEIDTDGDGCLDEEDSYPYSNMEATVDLHGCDSGVDNRVTSACGVMMSDLIDQLEVGTYRNHGGFVKEVAHLTETWLMEGLITEDEKDAIVACAGQSN